MADLLTRSYPALREIRGRFPALGQDFAFLENAGGSQVPASVPEAIAAYMRESYVQLGAPYEISRKATAVVAEAHRFAEAFVNGEGIGKAILGASTTQLCAMLAECYERALHPGDEIVIAETAHEANAGPWARMESKGFKVRTWKIDPQTYESPLAGLEGLLSDRTKIVALPHVSNLLGGVADVAAVAKLARRVGARVVADGVAYAPHRSVDVKAWDVDFYVYSVYKVFGPHMAVLFAKDEALAELTGPNHFFIPNSDPYKFEPGGPSHEACAGLVASRDYFAWLAGQDSFHGHSTAAQAYDHIEALEQPLQEKLLAYLKGRSDVQVIGPTSTGSERVPTISFVHRSIPSSEVARRICGAGIGVRNGHMYAYRMCETLGIDLNEGVVRVSAVHYNTPEEIDRLVEVLDTRGLVA
jgi:cysteine desulfurase family protein (TIGR01976 family)